MSTVSTTGKPATPRGTTPMQALSGLLRTPTRLLTPTAVGRRKKRKAHSRSSSLSTPSTPNTPSLPAVVLQTYSLSTDSIVLTSLPSAPFCCHEDLLTMSRTQLEGVVRALNARLPCRMQIGPEEDIWQNDDQERIGRSVDDDDDGLSRMSEAEMKKRIEQLVGIRAVVGKNRVSRSGLGLGTRTRVPPAPKAVRTRDAKWRPYDKTPWEMEVDATEDQSDGLSVMIEDAFVGSSPLASRTKSSTHSHGRNGASSCLAILQEENEGCESKEEDPEDNEMRPSKRQRVSSGGITRHSEEESRTVQEGRQSRLIENMDLSGSPFLAGEDDVLSSNIIESDESRVATAINPDHGIKTSKEDVQVTLQRRRSARIQEIALRRASSVDKARKGTRGTRGLKSSIPLSKTLSSRRLPRNTPTMMGGFDFERDSNVPRELTIRLPFTSTPPHQSADSSAWSASRILRSHSQRLLKSSKSAKTTASLGRSQSEKYPRATDLTFVTIDRPRYRFIRRRKSKVSEVTKGSQEPHPLMSASPAHASCHHIGTGQSNEQLKCEKENEDLKVDNGNPMGNLHNFSSTLRGFLTPRSRAPSTSTVASTRGNLNDSPAQTAAKEVTAPVAFADSVVSDGTTERVWEALERMAVVPQ